MTTRGDETGTGRDVEESRERKMSDGNAGDSAAGSGDPGKPKRSSRSNAESESSQTDLPPIDPDRLAAAEQMGKLAAEAAVSRRGLDAVLLKVTGRCSYTDYILVVEAESDRQVDALSNRIQRTLRDAGGKPLGVEGRGDGGWVLLDFGDLVVHVFRRDLRSFYDIEGLWHDVPRVDLAAVFAAAEGTAGAEENETDDWEDEDW